MIKEKIHSGPGKSSGHEVWICKSTDPEDFGIQPYVEINVGCFTLPLDQISLNFLIEGLAKAWYEIHKDNHANCDCRESGSIVDNPFKRKGKGQS